MSVELPFGNFELREESATPMVCVVGGTGFAPVKSLLDDMVKKAIQRPVTLIWGGRDRGGLYLMSAVERWQKRMPDFRFVAAIEDSADAVAIGAVHGRADIALRREVGTLAGSEVYCCGAPPMVAAVKKACMDELSLASTHFFSDVFVPGPAVAAP